MPMLRRGYGAVKNLRCKSGARFPPSTDWMYLAKTYRCGLGPWLSLDVSDTPTLQLTKRPETHAFLQFSLQTIEACGILTILGEDVMGFHSQHSVNTQSTLQSTLQPTLPKRWKNQTFLDFHQKKLKFCILYLKMCKFHEMR